MIKVESLTITQKSYDKEEPKPQGSPYDVGFITTPGPAPAPYELWFMEWLRKRHPSTYVPSQDGSYTERKTKQSTCFPKCKQKTETIAVSDYMTGRLKIFNLNKIVEANTIYSYQIAQGTTSVMSVHSTEKYVRPQSYWLPGVGAVGNANLTYRIEVLRSKTRWTKKLEEEWLIDRMAHFSVDEGLVTEALAQINAKTLDLLTTLAELPETIQMIVDILKKVADLIVGFKKEMRHLSKILKDPKELSEQAASLWLQYRYGIMPLIYTVQGALEVLEEQSKGVEFIDVKKKKTITSKVFIDIEVEQIHRVFIKRRIVDFTVDNSLLINPALTAWELVTLSFVIDWFLNIGDILASLQEPKYDAQVAQYSIKTTIKGSNKTHEIDCETYVRKSINPRIHINLQFSPHINMKRALDAMALLRVIVLK